MAKCALNFIRQERKIQINLRVSHWSAIHVLDRVAHITTGTTLDLTVWISQKIMADLGAIYEMGTFVSHFNHCGILDVFPLY